MTWSTGTVTVTTTVAHGFTISDTLYLTIAGVTPAGYNGTYLCTVTGASTFTFPLGSNPGSVTVQGNYTPEDVNELLSMATTFFAQGYSTGVFVLELGPGNPADGVTALTNYITNNPNSNYVPGASGYFYSYLVPRTWDAAPSFISFLANYTSNTSRTYFYVTTTLQNYGLYTSTMKDVVALVESPVLGVYPANVLTAISWNTGIVTATTTTNHGVVAGNYFTITGVTPAGYNGTFLALPGTSASTLIYALTTNPGTQTVLGTINASYYANSGIANLEFSLAAAFQVSLDYSPSSTNKVPPFSYSFLYGVTPFPNQGVNTFTQNLRNANVNWVNSAAQGGLSNTMLLWGTTMDGNDLLYWYSVDWVQINLNVNTANAVINGSNNTINPLYNNQPGLQRLQTVAMSTMQTGIVYGLVQGNVVLTSLDPTTFLNNLNNGVYFNQTVINIVPFVTYNTLNPSDYKLGRYAGITVVYMPTAGFISIVYNLNVTQLIAQ
jgi:phage tail protein X